MRPYDKLDLALCVLAMAPAAYSQTATQTTMTTHSTVDISTVTRVSGCHAHGSTQYCMVGTTEFRVMTTATAIEALPTQYTGCHAHSTELWCIAPDGEEVQLEVESGEEEDHNSDQEQESEGSSGRNCHFHAGVEHCIGGSENEASASTCQRTDREYNIPLRIGLLFVILITSAFGVFGPIILARFFHQSMKSIVFVVLKQFGTGVIISTAFVHLYTHASLMFNNECLGELEYESTTSAILMAGIFLSFLFEYAGRRIVQSHSSHRVANIQAAAVSGEESSKAARSNTDAAIAELEQHGLVFDRLGVIVLEAGIIFHSLLIGLTLVVSGDSFFLTLFVVILFHQMFEGIALGTCIAALPTGTAPNSTPTIQKFIMAAVFALVTPIGMAIGIGVLHQFNGNDRSTIIAIGTLDALSAGVLVWVGLIEMWGRDWLQGDLKDANLLKAGVAMVALIAGMAVMSLLGKWA